MCNKLISIFVFMVLAGAMLCAQTTTGQITGEVVDASGAKVPNARLTATSLETGATQSAQSNDDGIYRLSALPVGTYKLTAEKEGFSLFTANNLILSTASTLRVDVSLSVGTITEAVEVTAVSPLLIHRNCK